MFRIFCLQTSFDKTATQIMIYIYFKKTQFLSIWKIFQFSEEMLLKIYLKKDHYQIQYSGGSNVFFYISERQRIQMRSLPDPYNWRPSNIKTWIHPCNMYIHFFKYYPGMFLEHRKDIQILENNYYVCVCGFFLLIQQRNIHHGTIIKIKRYS